MSFETPAALWALGALLLLVIFSLWRQAAVRTVVPSLLIWKKIPERNPPIRALRRPAWRWELLLTALAIAATVLGIAGPYLELDRPKPRRVGIVVDTSARLRDRLGRLVEAARSLGKDEAATYYAADPSPRSSKDPGEFRIVDVHVDVQPLLALARAANDAVVLVSDRAPSGVEAELIAGPSNAGIVEFNVGDGEVFARLANHGEAKRVKATLTIDGRAEDRDLELPAGERGWFEKRDLSKAASVTLALPADAFPADDVAGASRSAVPETAVSLRGLDSPMLRRALAGVPGVVLRKADVVIVPHALTRGLNAKDIGTSGVGELPPGGEALITAGGAPVMTLNGDVLNVAVSIAPSAWPATASFPIFWSDVIQFARRGRSSFATARTGRPVEAKGGPPGAIWLPGPEGTILPYSVGEYGPTRVNLLDPRETDAAGTSRRAARAGGAGGTMERARAPLGGWAAGAALGFLLMAWVLRGRTD